MLLCVIMYILFMVKINVINDEYCYCVAMVKWLPLLHNFIQLNLKLDSGQVQILLAACWRFAMMRISGNDPDENKAKRLSSVNDTTKIIHRHYHHRHHHQTDFEVALYCWIKEKEKY